MSRDINIALKILIDTFPHLHIVVTGSSSLALAHGIQETLTGRIQVYRLFPLSIKEKTKGMHDHEIGSILDDHILYGGYPYLEQLNTPSEKIEYLTELASEYLFRDILYLQDIQHPDIIRRLTMYLAFQIGSQVSHNELSQKLGISVATVQRYLSILQQGFVIIELPSFSRNLRNELDKSKKYYFWDTGIRNALIGQFHELTLRPDKGGLWENAMVIERMKRNEYVRYKPQYHFWRTYEGYEVDYLEVYADSLHAYEFKFTHEQSRTPKVFKEAYNTQVQTISPETFLDFIT